MSDFKSSLVTLEGFLTAILELSKYAIFSSSKQTRKLFFDKHFGFCHTVARF